MVDDIDALRLAFDELSAERDSLVQAHQAELDLVKETARQTVLRAALRAEAERLGAHDPDLVLDIVDRSAIEWREDGLPSGVEAAIAGMRTARGYLFREDNGSALGDGRDGAGPVPRPATGEAPDARLLPEQDYAARKRQFLAGII